MQQKTEPTLLIWELRFRNMPDDSDRKLGKTLIVTNRQHLLHRILMVAVLKVRHIAIHGKR